MIVVDANVVAHFFIEGPKTALARRLHDRDAHWIVPGLWPHEHLNILVTSCLFAKLPLESAARLWADAQELLGGNIVEPDMKAVLSTAVARSVTAYDAQYVTLAREKGVLCVTEDAALRKAFPETAVSMATFLAGQDGPRTAVREPAPVYRSRRKR